MFSAFLPVLSKLEVIHCKDGSDEFEDSQRDASGIDVLKYLADGLLRRRLVETDDRHLVLLSRIDNLCKQFCELLYYFGIVVMVGIVVVLPVLLLRSLG